MGKSEPVLTREQERWSDVWLILLQILLLALLWFLLWQSRIGYSMFEAVNSGKYLRIVLLTVTVLYAVLTGFITQIIIPIFYPKSSRLKSVSDRIPFSASTSGLSGYLVFSLVWISYLRAATGQSSMLRKVWVDEPYRFYVLLIISAIVYFVFEQIALATKGFVTEKNKIQTLVVTQRAIRRRVVMFSYLLLLLLTIVTNGIIQNFWLLLFSLVILQIVFPFLIVFGLDNKPFNSEEYNYKQWLVKKGIDSKTN